MSTTANRVQSGVSEGGQYTHKQHGEPVDVTLSADSIVDRLSSATPDEVDTELAALMEVTGRAAADLDRAELQADSVARGLAEATPGGYAALYSYGPEVQEKAATKVAACRTAFDEATAAEAPFHDEFDRRGGWDRAFLVTNAGGHVHTSTRCASCFPTTQFAMLPQFSGHGEDEVVAAAGDHACTVCFPSAPVDVLRRPSTIEEPARRVARLEREQKAAAKAAKAALTAITNPDGSPLNGQWGVIKTERAAQVELVDIIASHRAYGYDAYLDVQDTIVAALAHKRGHSVDQVRADVEGKVTAKLRRDARG